MQSILKEPLLLVSLGGLREFNQGQILRALFPRENKQRNQTKDKLYFAFFFFFFSICSNAAARIFVKYLEFPLRSPTDFKWNIYCSVHDTLKEHTSTK